MYTSLEGLGTTAPQQLAEPRDTNLLNAFRAPAQRRGPPPPAPLPPPSGPPHTPLLGATVGCEHPQGTLSQGHGHQQGWAALQSCVAGALARSVSWLVDMCTGPHSSVDFRKRMILILRHQLILGRSPSHGSWTAIDGGHPMLSLRVSGCSHSQRVEQSPRGLGGVVFLTVGHPQLVRQTARYIYIVCLLLASPSIPSSSTGGSRLRVNKVGLLNLPNKIQKEQGTDRIQTNGRCCATLQRMFLF